jgi:hypothetical protein
MCPTGQQRLKIFHFRLGRHEGLLKNDPRRRRLVHNKPDLEEVDHGDKTLEESGAPDQAPKTITEIETLNINAWGFCS